MANITAIGTGNTLAVGAATATKPVSPTVQNELRAANIPSSTGDHKKTNTTTDETKLSSSSTLIQQALQLQDAPSDKIAALQSSIAKGTYFVPASAVANKLIESLLG